MKDTGENYLEEEVNYGGAYPFVVPLSDETKTSFTENTLRTAASIDERNLSKCIRLNLLGSSVEALNTQYFELIRVLVICATKIDSLQTQSLSTLLFLDISGT